MFKFLGERGSRLDIFIRFFLINKCVMRVYIGYIYCRFFKRLVFKNYEILDELREIRSDRFSSDFDRVNYYLV